MAIVDEGVEIWEESVLMILHCRFLDFLFARCQNGHFSDAVKRPFLRSSFSIFPESVLNCWTSAAVRLRSRKSLPACASVFNVCWNWGSRSPNSISFAARDSRNCCQSGSSLLDRLGDGSAALACGQSSQNAWGQLWQQILLINGLPAHGYNKTELERNVWHYFQKSGVSWECLAAMHTHTLTTDSSVMCLEFTTEIARNEFFQHTRNTKNVWLIHGEEYGKAKVENDIPTSERLVLQPYYTLLDLFQDILPADMKWSNGELQSDRATLQTRPDKNDSTQQLLAQVTYLLDNRFPRHYVCVLFIVENYLEDIQQAWSDAFTHRMQHTLELIQALSKSAVDKTRRARHNVDKALDISNIRFPHQQFPFPIMFISMAPSLAKLLSDHPSLPLQIATGLLPIVSSVLMKYRVDASDYGKGGKFKGKLNNKGSGGYHSNHPNVNFFCLTLPFLYPFPRQSPQLTHVCASLVPPF